MPSSAGSEAAPPGPVSLIGVYRYSNVEYVRELVVPALAEGWTVAWWALDEVIPELADVTVGSGAGTKLPLLNEVLARSAARDGWLIVSDDDVSFVRGGLVDLVSLTERADFAIAQPARADPDFDHRITATKRLSIARRTTFVEGGPLFVVAPEFSDRILPFSAARRMGWGVELDWIDLLDEGLKMGVVDAVQMRHEGTRGEQYDGYSYLLAMQAELEGRGVGRWPDLQRTLGTWRPWQASPPWTRTTARA